MDVCVTMAGAALCGDCVTAETLRHVARQTGLPVWEEAQDKALEALAASGKANGTPLVLLATNLTPERLEKALSLPFLGCVEFAHEAATTGEHLLSTMEAGGLYLSLASDTAHSVEPARFYVEALQHRLELSEWQRQSIEL
ncbi:MAG: hypothetical protein K2Q10_01025, partial [Rhodospirillales bacterium]|nr:hypothetical protein [Rhodospirillales bacterium]